MAINPNEINIKNIIELIQSSSIKDNDLLVIGQGIYARKSTVLELYNKFGVPSILTSLNSLQFQINQLNNTVGNSVLYSPQVKTPQQRADARNNLDVYSRSETQTVVNTAIINLGNVVNSVTNVNPALVDNSDPKNPVIAEFREISDYNSDMLNKADIDGNLTIGGIWWQDQVLSDRFSNYKQVWTALSNNTIEWGNIELDKHIFLVDDINGLKIKVGGTEGTIWNTLNLTNVSQLNNDAGYLQANDLDGFIYDVTYNSSAHTITFYQQNQPNIVVDLPIEQLIKGVQLVGNDLIFTFEDGSTVTVPLNTLLVGVVKSVNGLTPNSQGEIVLNVTDIPNLSSELANKLDIRMAGLVSNLTQPEKDAILSKLGVVNNIVQVLGLSGNTITLSNGGGSISLNIANIGGLQNALDLKANVNGNNITNIADWRNNLGVYSTTQVDGFLAGKANSDATNLTNIPNWQSALGITTALNLNLQQVTNNGNVTTHNASFNGLDIGKDVGIFQVIATDVGAVGFTNTALSSAINILAGGLLISDMLGSANLIPTNGIYSKGTIATASHGTSADWNAKVNQSQLANYALLSQVYTQSQALALFVGLNGVQTIADTKTFTSSPIVPNATLSGHAVNKSQLDALASSIPTVGNGQLSFTAPTGLNISGTFSANQSGNTNIPITWQAGYQGFTTAEATKLAGIQAGATVPNNGTFAVQGTGALTGTGSTSANASANTSATLDLTPQTKSDINQGKQAGKQIGDLFGSLSVYYQYHDVSGGGTTIDTNKAFFNLVNPMSTTGISVGILPHSVHGARLVLQGFLPGSGGVITYTGMFINRNGTNVNSIMLENNSKEYVWDVDADSWREVF